MADNETIDEKVEQLVRYLRAEKIVTKVNMVWVNEMMYGYRGEIPTWEEDVADTCKINAAVEALKYYYVTHGNKKWLKILTSGWGVLWGGEMELLKYAINDPEYSDAIKKRISRHERTWRIEPELGYFFIPLAGLLVVAGIVKGCDYAYHQIFPEKQEYTIEQPVDKKDLEETGSGRYGR